MSIVGNIQSHLDTGQFSAGVLVAPKNLFDIVDHELEYYGITRTAK